MPLRACFAATRHHLITMLTLDDTALARIVIGATGGAAPIALTLVAQGRGRKQSICDTARPQVLLLRVLSEIRGAIWRCSLRHATPLRWDSARNSRERLEQMDAIPRAGRARNQQGA